MPTRKKDKIVTVCLANRARSPTAEWLLHRNYKVKSCGTAEFDATKPCDKWEMKWATKVLVMEPYQKANLEARFPEARGKVEVLDVPEVGKYSCQPSLLTEIAQRLEEHHLKVRNIKDTTRASYDCAEWTSRNAERKMRSAQTQSYALTDYWTPEQALDVWEEGVVTRPTGALEPWQIEERRAFERAASASTRGQGGITRVSEDEGGMRVWLGDKELNEDEVAALFTGTKAKRAASEKVADALKKYTEDIKKFFKS